MKVFLSWSGPTSRAVASGLRVFLADVNYKIRVWMSNTDIDAGTRWSRELAEELQETDFGIICLTRESMDSPWLYFEAGALSKSTNTSRVCPYLVGLQPSLLMGPLSQFQSMEATRDGTLLLLHSINNSMSDNMLSREQLERNFGRCWPDFEEVLLRVGSKSMLSKKDRTEFAKLVVSCFRGGSELEMLMAESDLPTELVNWNQALLYVARNVVDVVEQEDRWKDFLDALERARPKRQDLQSTIRQLRDQIRGK